MKKFIVETYYTCTFKTVHTLNELNDQELSKIDSRNDGEVEVIDVKLNNRKTKKYGEKTSSPNNLKQADNLLSTAVSKEIINSKNHNKTDNKTPTILPNKSLYWNDLFGIIKCKTSRIIEPNIK